MTLTQSHPKRWHRLRQWWSKVWSCSCAFWNACCWRATTLKSAGANWANCCGCLWSFLLRSLQRFCGAKNIETNRPLAHSKCHSSLNVCWFPSKNCYCRPSCRFKDRRDPEQICRIAEDGMLWGTWATCPWSSTKIRHPQPSLHRNATGSGFWVASQGQRICITGCWVMQKFVLQLQRPGWWEWDTQGWGKTLHWFWFVPHSFKVPPMPQWAGYLSKPYCLHTKTACRQLAVLPLIWKTIRGMTHPR